MNKNNFCMALFLFLLMGTAHAQNATTDQNSTPPQGQQAVQTNSETPKIQPYIIPPTPPDQSRIDACEDKAEGDNCSFFIPQTGVCTHPAGDKKDLACLSQGYAYPNRPKIEGQAETEVQNHAAAPEPAQFLIDACADEDVGNACKFSDSTGDHTGTCAFGADKKTLACVATDTKKAPAQGQQPQADQE